MSKGFTKYIEVRDISNKIIRKFSTEIVSSSNTRQVVMRSVKYIILLDKL